MNSSLPLNDLHIRFIREKNYLDGVSPKTIRFLTQSYNAFTRSVPSVSDAKTLEAEFTRIRVDFPAALRETGIKSVSVNTYIRGINCFLTWLHENDFVSAKLSIKQLRVEKGPPTTVSHSNLGRLIGYKPTTFSQRRVHAMTLTIIDTGCRIGEVTTLRRDGLDLDTMTLRVVGKGRKARLLPFSPELRRVLFRWTELVRAVPSDLVFTTQDGGEVAYRNLRRDYDTMLRRLDLTGIVGGFHRLRHTFATEFMRRGGNQFHLQLLLGHADLKTTGIYVHAATDDLRAPSLLSRRSRQQPSDSNSLFVS